MQNATIRESIKAAFRRLRKLGYEAHMDWWCCQTCGCAALKAGTVNYVFYHDQDAAAFGRDGNLGGDRGGLYLAWGGDGNVIRSALEDEGLSVEWNGKDDQCIVVTGRKSDATL